MAFNGWIFLTTDNPAIREPATLALAIDTGRTLWKQIAPASRTGEFSSFTGSAVPPRRHAPASASMFFRELWSDLLRSRREAALGTADGAISG